MSKYACGAQRQQYNSVHAKGWSYVAGIDRRLIRGLLAARV